MTSKSISIVVASVLIMAGCAQPAAEVSADENSGLYGGWLVSDWVMPDHEVTAMPAEQGLFLFTASGHYSMMWVPTADRPALPDEPSDLEIAAAYNTFVANSGRYTVDGGIITYEAYMGRDPAYMGRFGPMGGEGNARSMSYTLNEDGTLTLEFVSADEYSAGVVATLRRPAPANAGAQEDEDEEHAEDADDEEHTADDDDKGASDD
jgi:hypothetical protein